MHCAGRAGLTLDQGLVEWQLRVTSGEALPKRQDELAIGGMAGRFFDEWRVFDRSVANLSLWSDRA